MVKSFIGSQDHSNSATKNGKRSHEEIDAMGFGFLTDGVKRGL
jgi:hypothetical protein